MNENATIVTWPYLPIQMNLPQVKMKIKGICDKESNIETRTKRNWSSGSSTCADRGLKTNCLHTKQGKSSKNMKNTSEKKLKKHQSDTKQGKSTRKYEDCE